MTVLLTLHLVCFPNLHGFVHVSKSSLLYLGVHGCIDEQLVNKAAEAQVEDRDQLLLSEYFPHADAFTNRQLLHVYV